MSKRSGGGAIRIAVAATSAVRRAGLESIIRSHADFHLSGSFGAVASMVPFARNTELDVIVIDSDSIRDLLLEPITRCYSFEDFHWTIPRDGVVRGSVDQITKNL
jgi:DNA-binding NarL/FixJ family response regulator